MCLSHLYTCVYGAVQVTQVLVRGSILMTEISVVIFGLFFSELHVCVHVRYE